MFQGSVEINKRDVNTLELKETISKSNTITLEAIQTLFMDDNSSYSSIIGGHSSSSSYRPRILVGNYLTNKINEATPNPASAQNNFILSAPEIVGEQNPILNEDYEDRKWQLIFKGQLNPPESGNREINFVCMGILASTLGGFAVFLDVPCIQESNEIFDIFYRINIIGNPNDINDHTWKSLYAIKLWHQWFSDRVGGTSVSGGAGAKGITNNTYVSLSGGNNSNNIKKRPYCSYPAPRSYYRYYYYASAPDPTTTRKNISQLTTQRDYVLGINNRVGTVFSSHKYWGDPNPLASVAFNDRNRLPFIQEHTVIPTSITPIQNTFKKTTSAVQPYLTSLGAGSSPGNIAYNAENFTSNAPLQYRVEFNNTGNVGVSEYRIKRKMCFGYRDNLYQNENIPGYICNSVPFMAVNTSNTSYDYGISFLQPDDNIPKDNNHDLLHFRRGINGYHYSNIQEYDEQHLISADAYGLSIINVYDDDYQNIDEYTNPNLTTEKLNDYCVDNNKQLWVATKDQGLFKISADFSLVSKITVPNVNDNICYSVDFKNDGTIWAAFSGGLAKSSDGGTTWNVYNEGSSEQFLISGVTDGNWDFIQGIVVDKDSPDDNLLIVLKNSNNVWWWSREGSVNSNSNAMDSMVSLDENTSQGLHSFSSQDHSFCVRKWIKHFPGTTSFVILNTSIAPDTNTSSYTADNYRVKTIDFLSSALRGTVAITGGNRHKMHTISFETDELGNMGILMTVGDTTVRLYDVDCNSLGDLGSYSHYSWNNNLNINTPRKYFESGYRSFIVAYMGGGVALVNNRPICMLFKMISDSSFDGGSKKHIIWQDYGWNGSSWELDHPGYKTTHTTYEATLDEGLQIAFEDDPVETSFIGGEYFDTFIYRGVHKDNATSLSYTVPTHQRNSKYLTDLTPPTIPNTPMGLVENKQLNFNTTMGVPSHVAQQSYQYNGMFGCTSTSTSRHRESSYNSIVSEITFDGDFSFSFDTSIVGRNSSASFISIGITTLNLIEAFINDPTYNSNPPLYYFSFNRSTYSVVGSSTYISNEQIPDDNSTFTIERVGSTLYFKINGSVVYEQLNITTDPVVATIRHFAETFRTLFNMNIDYYTETRRIVELGDPTNFTGLFDPNYAMVESFLTPLSCKVKIGGNDAYINTTTPIPSPLSGTVTLLPKTGWLVLNDADAGLPIEAEYQVLYKFTT